MADAVETTPGNNPDAAFEEFCRISRDVVKGQPTANPATDDPDSGPYGQAVLTPDEIRRRRHAALRRAHLGAVGQGDEAAEEVSA